MSDPAKTPGLSQAAARTQTRSSDEIEDVLSSIRRLVSESQPGPDGTMRPRPVAPEPTPAPDRLVLTAALRVADPEDPWTPVHLRDRDTVPVPNVVPTVLATEEPRLQGYSDASEAVEAHEAEDVELVSSDDADSDFEDDGLGPDVNAEVEAALAGNDAIVTPPPPTMDEGGDVSVAWSPDDRLADFGAYAPDSLQPIADATPIGADLRAIDGASGVSADTDTAVAPFGAAPEADTIVLPSEMGHGDAEPQAAADDAHDPEPLDAMDLSAYGSDDDAAHDAIPEAASAEEAVADLLGGRTFAAAEFEPETGDANWPDDSASRAALDLAAVRSGSIRDAFQTAPVMQEPIAEKDEDDVSSVFGEHEQTPEPVHAADAGTTSDDACEPALDDHSDPDPAPAAREPGDPLVFSRRYAEDRKAPTVGARPEGEIVSPDEIDDFGDQTSPFTFPDTDGQMIDEHTLREIIADVVREELQGNLGQRITRNVRKMVRREIRLVIAADELD